jgi:predicted  nucleic acid-binding Zn-ribbon protein
MQQDKDIQKTYTIGSDENKNANDIFQTLSRMKIMRIGQFFNSVKRCGVNVSDIILLLMLMPFHHLKSVPTLVKSGLSSNYGVECGNNVFYDLKNNPKINWRSLLYLIALRFKYLSKSVNSDIIGNVRAFIFDDSTLPKSGIKTEFVSRVHDHVSGDFIFGYKIMVMGYWDGLSFYPLDFTLHREKGGQIDKVKQRLSTTNKRLAAQRQVKNDHTKLASQAKQTLKSIKKQNKNKSTKTAAKHISTATNKLKRAKQKLKVSESKYIELENKATEIREELKEVKKSHPYYGLTTKQKDEQFKKYRDDKTPGAQRAAEVDSKKTTSAMTMLKNAVKRGFLADYVLTDSWFYNYELVALISKLNKKIKLNLISMARMGTTKYKLSSTGKYYNANELVIKFERKAINARSHKAKYIKIPVVYGDIRINLFFIKMGKFSGWRLLATTDLTINFQKLMDVYQIRWSIELFFRESKQYLNLGKSKSTCFDAQIADATISLSQYVILSFHRRILEYSSFEGIFASAIGDAMQNSIASELQKMFWIILEIYSNFTGVDIIEVTRSVFRDEQVCNKIKLLNPIFFENLKKCEAA